MRKPSIVLISTLLFALNLARASLAAAEVGLYDVFEATFSASNSYTNPYTQASMTATFTGPSGQAITVNGFWDGGNTWKVRFASTAIGTWAYTTSSADPGFNGKTGSFEVISSTNKGSMRAKSGYPLHFEYQDGTPFYFFGDTQWVLTKKIDTENLNRATLLHYIDVRASQGFNYIHANIGEDIASTYNEGGYMWIGSKGNQINPAHFQEIDYLIQYLNSKGITLGLMLDWAQGWQSFSSMTERLIYARYIVARYSAYNVIFIVSGEYDEAGIDYNAIGNEIKANDSHKRMIAIHGTGSVESFADQPWISFGDYKQIYGNLHSDMLASMDHSKPVINSEYAYYLRDSNEDGVVDKPNSATLKEIRDATWDIAMSGGYFVTGWGTTYFGGIRDSDRFNNIDDAKNDDWEEDVQWIKKFFTDHEWWRLSSADSSVSGSGTKYVLREIGKQYLIYVRGGSGSLSLLLSTSSSATYTVQRFDPRTGLYTALADYSGLGPVSISIPDTQDWLFSVKLKTSTDATPPSIPTGLTAGAVSSSQINLSWVASTDNVGVTGYRIYRCQGSSCTPSTQVATSASNSYSDTGLSASTIYTYRVAAYDASGNVSGQFTGASATTEDFSGGNIINANPSNYLSLLSTLKPGDTLLLAQGNYYGLPVYNINGTASNPITIKGPDSGTKPIILGSSGENTLRINNSSYVIIKNLEINSRNLGGDPVNGQGVSHHITLENLYIHGFSDDQGTVGISTNRAPVWNWTICNNIITDGGTGMYLGNSDGNEPFIAGIIENNLVYDTIGYNIEIKHQNPRPTNIAGMPQRDNKTIIRNNVFSKANNASTGSMARPNLLVGHFPLSGVGMNDVYEIYGNFFYQNPTGEPLFQGEGNVAFYNNLLFNSVDPTGAYPAVYIAPHNDKPRDVRVFNNTIVTKNSGISVSGGYTNFQQKVIGNAVFAANPISASDKADNITDTYQNASNYLTNPFASLGTFDLFPKSGKLIGTQIDVSSFNTFTDWSKDFNGITHTGVFRGAYEGEGQNPGWLPKLEIKPISSISLKGDVNQDNSVNSIDLQALVNHILGSQDYGSNADVNSDSSVDALDVQEVVNIILGG